MRLQAVQRQMIAQFADNHVGQQSRPGQTLGNRGGGHQRSGESVQPFLSASRRAISMLRLAIALVATLRAGLAGIFVADVLEDFEAGRDGIRVVR